MRHCVLVFLKWSYRRSNFGANTILFSHPSLNVNFLRCQLRLSLPRTSNSIRKARSVIDPGIILSAAVILKVEIILVPALFVPPTRIFRYLSPPTALRQSPKLSTPAHPYCTHRILRCLPHRLPLYVWLSPSPTPPTFVVSPTTSCVVCRVDGRLLGPFPRFLLLCPPSPVASPTRILDCPPPLRSLFVTITQAAAGKPSLSLPQQLAFSASSTAIFSVHLPNTNTSTLIASPTWILHCLPWWWPPFLFIPSGSWFPRTFCY